MRSLRLKGAALPSRVQSGDAPAVCPTGGGILGAVWRSAMDENHIWMLGVNLTQHLAA